jgi:hypothetical protein
MKAPRPAILGGLLGALLLAAAGTPYPVRITATSPLVVTTSATNPNSYNISGGGSASLSAGTGIDGAQLAAGTVAVDTSDSLTWNAPQTFRDQVTYPPSVTTTNINWAGSTVRTLTVSSNATISFAGQATGQFLEVVITNAGSYTLTWPTIAWGGSLAPVLTPGGTDVYTLQDVGGTIYGSVVQDVGASGGNPKNVSWSGSFGPFPGGGTESVGVIAEASGSATGPANCSYANSTCSISGTLGGEPGTANWFCQCNSGTVVVWGQCGASGGCAEGGTGVTFSGWISVFP